MRRTHLQAQLDLRKEIMRRMRLRMMSNGKFRPQESLSSLALQIITGPPLPEYLLCPCRNDEE